MDYVLTHRTTYSYGSACALSQNMAHLEPLPGPFQKVGDFALEVTPQPREWSSRVDYFGNRVNYFAITEPHEKLVVESRSRVTVTAPPQSIPGLSASCAEVRRHLTQRMDPPTRQALEMTFASPRVPLLQSAREFAGPFLTPDRPFLVAVLDLAAAIYSGFDFKPGVTDAETPVAEFFEGKRGVCQDFAHFMIACLRAHGLPATYVSGYIRTYPPPGAERLRGADASHAWVSVCLPGYGWVDVDPTNNGIPRDEHITLARGRDYSDVSLIRGTTVGGGGATIEVSVDMALA